MFENKQGKSSGRMNLKFETKKGNNTEQDVGIKSCIVTTVVEEARRWLCELDSACEQMAYKISHIIVGSKGSTPCLVKDMAKDCVEGDITCLNCLDDMTKSCVTGDTTCLKCLDGMTESCMERYVDDIGYTRLQA